jgi:hypothetical protein
VAPGDTTPPLRGAFLFDLLRAPAPASSYGSSGGAPWPAPTAAAALAAPDPLLTLCVTREAVPAADAWSLHVASPAARASLVHVGLTRELLAVGDLDWRQVRPRLAA